MPSYYDLFSPDETVAQEQAAALQAVLRRNEGASALAALSGAKSLQPFAQLLGASARQQQGTLAGAGESRLKLAMQRQEHQAAREQREADRAEDRAWREQQAREQRAWQAGQNELYRRQVGGAVQPVTAEQAAALKKIGVDPAGLRSADEAAKMLTNPRAYGIQLANDKFEWQKDEKNELSPAQAEGIAEYDNTIALLDKIMREKPQVDTGPVANVTNRLTKALGIQGKKGVQLSGFRSDVEDNLANYIRSISGKAASDLERRFLAGVQPEVSNQDETFEEMSKRLRERLVMAREERMRVYRESGRNTKGISGPAGGGSVGTPLQGDTQPAAAAGGGADLTDIAKLYGLE